MGSEMVITGGRGKAEIRLIEIVDMQRRNRKREWDLERGKEREEEEGEKGTGRDYVESCSPNPLGCI